MSQRFGSIFERKVKTIFCKTKDLRAKNRLSFWIWSSKKEAAVRLDLAYRGDTMADNSKKSRTFAARSRPWRNW